MRAARTALSALTLVLLAGSLAGCGGEQADSDSPPDPALTITFAEGDVSPKGERVSMDAGTPFEFTVVADEAGTLHVHSSPEQELDYAEGTTELSLTIPKPGIVDVESHELEVIVVQLEAR